MKQTTLLILAGGESSRFWPLPHKLLIPFLGTTLLEHVIEMYEDAGFEDIVVVSNKEIVNRFAGVGIKMVVQKGVGQGAAVLSAAPSIHGQSLFVVNANDIVDPTLIRTAVHKIKQASHNFLVGIKPKRYFPGGYLVLEGDRIKGIQEKPGEGNEPSKWIKLVFDYFHNSDRLFEALSQTKADPVSHYEEAISTLIRQGEQFELLPYEKLWLTLKYPWHTLPMMEYFLSTIKKSHISSYASVHKTAVIHGPVKIDKGARVMEFAKIMGPAYIGAGAIVGNHTLIRESMIGENAVVGFGSEITRSYIGTDSWFHTNYVGDSVIADHVGMGAGSVTANLRLDESEIATHVKDQRVNTERVKLGAIIGANARIGIEAQLMPGVKVGRGSVIGPGVILTKDLEDQKRCMVKQEHAISEVALKLPQDRGRFRKKL